eukprot:TRINITY_DN11289_c0_g1_i1.p1 TRINITY_DN11289_c0_g1~~TRINITY_DN11289_c0_g1_i1.p1  ORF type:complete len:612 (-),score=143.37 TRINITY_DN11289_c0_g1_i1:46-1881(-)
MSPLSLRSVSVACLCFARVSAIHSSAIDVESSKADKANEVEIGERFTHGIYNGNGEDELAQQQSAANLNDIVSHEGDGQDADEQQDDGVDYDTEKNDEEDNTSDDEGADEKEDTDDDIDADHDEDDFGSGLGDGGNEGDPEEDMSMLGTTSETVEDRDEDDTELTAGGEALDEDDIGIHDNVDGADEGINNDNEFLTDADDSDSLLDMTRLAAEAPAAATFHNGMLPKNEFRGKVAMWPLLDKHLSIKLFKILDSNGNGHIDQDELDASLSVLNQDTSSDKVGSILAPDQSSASGVTSEAMPSILEANATASRTNGTNDTSPPVSASATVGDANATAGRPFATGSNPPRELKTNVQAMHKDDVSAIAIMKNLDMNGDGVADEHELIRFMASPTAQMSPPKVIPFGVQKPSSINQYTHIEVSETANAMGKARVSKTAKAKAAKANVGGKGKGKGKAKAKSAAHKPPSCSRSPCSAKSSQDKIKVLKKRADMYKKKKEETALKAQNSLLRERQIARAERRIKAAELAAQEHLKTLERIQREKDKWAQFMILKNLVKEATQTTPGPLAGPSPAHACTTASPCEKTDELAPAPGTTAAAPAAVAAAEAAAAANAQ